MIKIRVANKFIGDGEKPFIIAEAGVNHDNDLEKAKFLIRKAAEAGADAIKFQTYTADTLVTKTVPRYWDKALDTDEGTTQHSAFNVMNSLTIEDYKEMKKYSDELGIIFLSTPFYLEAVDLLEEVNVPAYKISSGDLTFHPLLRKVAKTGKPIIMSVGASTIDEVKESINVIRSEGNNKIIILHCMLSYPCEDKNANLAKIKKLKEIFPDIPIGYSDHTRGLVPPIAAMAMGACVVEKHYTGDKSSKEISPDHRFAISPEELKQLTDASKSVYDSLGVFSEKHYPAEEKAHELDRRVIVAERTIRKGEKITEDMLGCKRAGYGLAPKNLDNLIGKEASKEIIEDEILSFDFINNQSNNIAIILARMGSFRIPGKVLKEINGIPVLKLVYERVKACQNICKVVIATSTNQENDELVNFCKKNEMEFFRGSEEDVLGRFYNCAEEQNKISPINAVVRITADAPFTDPNLTDEMITFLTENNCDYVHNRHKEGPSLGLHAEVISFQTLKKLNEKVFDRIEREHVTLHILKPENREKFKIKLLDAPISLQRPQYRLLLDEKEDFEVVSKIFQDLGKNPSSEEVMSYLDKHQEVASINKDHGLDFKNLLDK